ncbi:hypothetical protein CDEF62S_00858 [Castellaniella defragrans]
MAGRILPDSDPALVIHIAVAAHDGGVIRIGTHCVANGRRSVGFHRGVVTQGQGRFPLSGGYRPDRHGIGAGSAIVGLVAWVAVGIDAEIFDAVVGDCLVHLLHVDGIGAGLPRAHIADAAIGVVFHRIRRQHVDRAAGNRTYGLGHGAETVRGPATVLECDRAIGPVGVQRDAAADQGGDIRLRTLQLPHVDGIKTTGAICDVHDPTLYIGRSGPHRHHATGQSRAAGQVSGTIRIAIHGGGIQPQGDIAGACLGAPADRHAVTVGACARPHRHGGASCFRPIADGGRVLRRLRATTDGDGMVHPARPLVGLEAHGHVVLAIQVRARLGPDGDVAGAGHRRIKRIVRAGAGADRDRRIAVHVLAGTLADGDLRVAITPRIAGRTDACSPAQGNAVLRGGAGTRSHRDGIGTTGGRRSDGHPAGASCSRLPQRDGTRGGRIRPCAQRGRIDRARLSLGAQRDSVCAGNTRDLGTLANGLRSRHILGLDRRAVSNGQSLFTLRVGVAPKRDCRLGSGIKPRNGVRPHGGRVRPDCLGIIQRRVRMKILDAHPLRVQGLFQVVDLASVDRLRASRGDIPIRNVGYFLAAHIGALERRCIDRRNGHRGAAARDGDILAILELHGSTRGHRRGRVAIGLDLPGLVGGTADRIQLRLVDRIGSAGSIRHARDFLAARIDPARRDTGPAAYYQSGIVDCGTRRAADIQPGTVHRGAGGATDDQPAIVQYAVADREAARRTQVDVLCQLDLHTVRRGGGFHVVRGAADRDRPTQADVHAGTRIGIERDGVRRRGRHPAKTSQAGSREKDACNHQAPCHTTGALATRLGVFRNRDKRSRPLIPDNSVNPIHHNPQANSTRTAIACFD